MTQKIPWLIYIVSLYFTVINQFYKNEAAQFTSILGWKINHQDELGWKKRIARHVIGHIRGTCYLQAESVRRLFVLLMEWYPANSLIKYTTTYILFLHYKSIFYCQFLYIIIIWLFLRFSKWVNTIRALAPPALLVKIFSGALYQLFRPIRN